VDQYPIRIGKTGTGTGLTSILAKNFLSTALHIGKYTGIKSKISHLKEVIE